MSEEQQLNNAKSGAKNKKEFWSMFWRELRNYAIISLVIGMLVQGFIILDQGKKINSATDVITTLTNMSSRQNDLLETLTNQIVGEKLGTILPVKPQDNRIRLKDFEAIDITPMLDERLQKVDVITSDSVDKMVLGFAFSLSDAQEAYPWLLGECPKNDLINAFILYGDIAPLISKQRSATVEFRSGVSTNCEVKFNKFLPAGQAYLMYYREKDQVGELQFKWKILWGTNDGIG